MNACTTHTPPIPQLRINSPASVAGTYAVGAAQFGPTLNAAGLTGNVVLGDDNVAPSSAYKFNPYNATLNTLANGNTNPLPGQEAFTGTDGGSLFGSWGQSQVNLTLLGVQRGNTIRLRSEFGMDGCSGNDGWYVDDIKVRVCTPPKGN